MKARPQLQSYRWVMLALIWLPYAAFGLVSRSIAPLVSPILSDLNMTYSEMGLVLGSWQLTYIVVGIIAGSITDRLGVKKAVFAGALIMVASACLRYFVTGFVPLLLTVALFGAGAPLISIGAPTVAAQWFSGKGRGIAVGIYTTSPSVGGLVALAATNSLVMPFVGFSWRLTFVFFGAVTFVIGLIWILLSREAGVHGSGARPSVRQTFLNLVRVPYVRIIFIGGLLAFATSHGMSNWLPNLFENHGLGASESGFLASVPMFTGIFSVLFVPTLTPARHRAKVVAIAALGNVASLVLLATASGALIVAGLVLFGLAGFAIFPMLMLMLMDSPEVGVGTMGLASGVFFAVAEIGGFSGPLLMGTLFDLTGGFLAGVFLLAALNLIITAMTLFLRSGTRDVDPVT